ncbi:hypothetical protein [Methylobacterium aerolatum]|uniref:Integron cassette protein VCH-CASS1 chain domain-containing protein n=1 Tax=Methylobacterium aerolatum TaxID=418708 RepID=A0ABU0I090_9HYPH|nr:hypothetical protein [Methylobacterium aerolatum]MDQ0447119.1 hypothetical protein [Methylobacterium aerolatum]GJD37098.1 hypothetical protein FMGBMHLM_4024 [Methylobacterium aerolatum]
MAMPTACGDTLRAYSAAVMRAADANSEEVVPVVLAVVGGILAAAERGSIRLQDSEDGAGGTLWATFGGEPMAFRFNPMTAMIELRVSTLDGHPARRFGRRSLAMDILNFFGPSRAAEAARTRPPADA